MKTKVKKIKRLIGKDQLDSWKIIEKINQLVKAVNNLQNKDEN
jgi:Txe/YoeB family toxin of Txe-Axe toxin-antitoxin module